MTSIYSARLFCCHLVAMEKHVYHVMTLYQKYCSVLLLWLSSRTGLFCVVDVGGGGSAPGHGISWKGLLFCACVRTRTHNKWLLSCDLLQSMGFPVISPLFSACACVRTHTLSDYCHWYGYLHKYPLNDHTREISSRDLSCNPVNVGIFILSAGGEIKKSCLYTVWRQVRQDRVNSSA